MPQITKDWHEANSHRFYTQRWKPDSEPIAHIIFVHGFMEHIARYDDWFLKLAERGYSLFAFDQRGFGRTAAETKTQGMTSQAKQLADLDYFVTREASLKAHDKKLFLFGHSMGGALVLSYASQKPTPPGLNSLAGVISSAPLIDQPAGTKASSTLIRLGSIVGAILPSLQMNVGVASKHICRDPAVQEAYANDPLCPPIGTYKGIGDMLTGGPLLLSRGYKDYPAELPLLLYHGSADKVTSHPASEEFARVVQCNDKTFESLEGFYHEPHNEPGDEKIKPLDIVDNWIRKRV